MPQVILLFNRYLLPLSVSLAILTAVLLPLNLLTLQPLHHDEALYATWALTIAAGKDFWLQDVAIDKPPLFLYTLAGAMSLLGVSETIARLPSLLATALTILLTFWLGRKLYDNSTGMLAAWLVALSPFTILFAPTAFTDPLLMALVLAACLSAVYGRAGWAAFFTGLAIAAKQQGVLFIPLIAALLTSCSEGVCDPRTPVADRLGAATRHAPRTTLLRIFITFLITLTLIFSLTLTWDLTRNQPSGFFQQSAINYGGLRLDLSNFGERWQGFIRLLFYATASPGLNAIFLIGCPILLIYGLWQNFTNKHAPALTDWFLALFVLLFLLLHAIFSFQIWDRYLLGLIPFLALLLARVLLLPSLFLKGQQGRASTTWPGILAIIILLSLTLRVPVQDAVNGRYPLGSNSHALQGIEQIIAYLQGRVGANTTLYHHWLGTHWRFYLWGYPYDLQYWDAPATLAAKARPGHLIAIPAWRSDIEIRIALRQAGLRLHELTRAYAVNGSPSLLLYEILPLVDSAKLTIDN
jgi:hypothetical protein